MSVGDSKQKLANHRYYFHLQRVNVVADVKHDSCHIRPCPLHDRLSFAETREQLLNLHYSFSPDFFFPTPEHLFYR